MELWILLSVVNLAIILWNFWIEPKRFYGRYPLVFIIAKIMILPLLFIHLWETMDEVPQKVALFVLFSWLGDIVLLFTQYIAFTLGGVLFLIAHLFIILHYNPPVDRLDVVVILIGLPSTIALFGILYPSILSKRIEYAGVIGYLAVLDGSLIASAQRKLVMDPLSAKYILGTLGHFLFTVSDFLLVRSLAERTEQTSNFGILLTYGSAQILICWSLAVQ
jgi:uncharacterized membrane protein YhhN